MKTLIKAFFVCFIVSSFILTLAGCAGHLEIQPGSTNMDMMIQAGSLQPGQWRLAAGETITITIENQSSASHHITLLADPYTAPFDEDDEASVLFEISVAGNSTIASTFTAPAAAGEYDVVCQEVGHAEEGEVGKIINVRIAE